MQKNCHLLLHNAPDTSGLRLVRRRPLLHDAPLLVVQVPTTIITSEISKGHSVGHTHISNIRKLN